MTPNSLKSTRLALRMTQEEFAKALGLKATHAARTLRAWEGGHAPLPDLLPLAVEGLLHQLNQKDAINGSST